MTESKLPVPVQSEYEPEHWSYLLRYGCGHVLHASGGKPETQEIAGKCHACIDAENPPDPEFVRLGQWARAQRMATYNTEREMPARKLAERMNINPVDVYSMEAGRQDPAPLVAFWQAAALDTPAEKGNR